MSEPALTPITPEEFAEAWPKDDTGRACAMLAKRYLVTMLIETAAGAECGDKAAAEAASSKAIARLTKVFGAVSFPKAEAPKRKPIAPLHRFTSKSDGEPTEKK